MDIIDYGVRQEPYLSEKGKINNVIMRLKPNILSNPQNYINAPEYIFKTFVTRKTYKNSHRELPIDML